ncbi:MAG TPA: peroxiredoxin [Geminicoccaceae bacterium]|nr:peroxiredoxin [Geminicoccaceae bacterium]
MASDFSTLPADLPVPVDDGACDHLVGMRVPDIPLPSTAGRSVVLAKTGRPRTVVYVYPRTGEPDKPSPPGWDAIPGARGCTPQSCGFRDHHRELLDLGAEVFGLSAQTTAYQQEMVERLHLPFEVLSDADLRFAWALRLPTFEVAGEDGIMTLIKRLTLVLRAGRIEHVFYPVFPPDRSAADTIAWLRAHPLPPSG